jgi:hypothetical protein
MAPIDSGPLARPGPPGVGLRAFSLFPLISDDMWCGDWAPRAAAVQ